MQKHTPGPWRWEFNASSKNVQLVGGTPRFDKTVMDLVRWGMGGAAPRFMGNEEGFCILHRLPDRKDWIRPFEGREHHAHWLASVSHPDARLMAAAPDLLEAAHGVDVLYAELGKALPGIVNTDAYDRVQQAVKQARSAIAKATTAT